MDELLTQVWRAVTIMLGAAALGMAGVVVREYAPKAIRRRQVRSIHVALIASSYCLLVGYQLVILIDRLVENDPASLRLVVNPLAFGLGVVALHLILRDIRRARQ